MYVNACAEYCVLQSVSEDHDPYDDCCYVNGATLHRNAEEILRTIGMDRDAGMFLFMLLFYRDCEIVAIGASTASKEQFTSCEPFASTLVFPSLSKQYILPNCFSLLFVVFFYWVQLVEMSP